MLRSFQKARECCTQNCLSQAISPIPTVFSKDFYCTHVKTWAFLGEGWTSLTKKKKLWKENKLPETGFYPFIQICHRVLYSSEQISDISLQSHLFFRLQMLIRRLSAKFYRLVKTLPTSYKS